MPVSSLRPPARSYTCDWPCPSQHETPPRVVSQAEQLLSSSWFAQTRAAHNGWLLLGLSPLIHIGGRAVYAAQHFF